MEPRFPFEPSPAASTDHASFSELVRKAAGGSPPPPANQGAPVEVPHATTILAVRYDDGVVMAGDRRATEGYSIAHRSIEKVFPTDDRSGIATAGAAGPAIEMTRLFQTELEHYEKIAGVSLTLEGKANKLSQLLRVNFPLAMQGLMVVPLFAGFDERHARGRIFKYDLTGGRYEESEYWATGSGGRDARATIKKRYSPDLGRDETVKIALEALFDASEEDVGTGGPDVLREIYPQIATITVDGFSEVPEEEIAALFEALLEERKAAGRKPSRERIVGSRENE
ncbi:MAG: proteasome subunit beta [Actinomycetota bacterium]